MESGPWHPRLLPLPFAGRQVEEWTGELREENTAPDPRRRHGSVTGSHALASPLCPNGELCTGITRVSAVGRVAWALNG